MPWMKTACFVIVLARFFVMTRASHGRFTNINACLFQLFLQLFAEQVVVHLGRVARAFVELQVGILHFMADSGLDVCRAFITARDFGAGQLRLVVRQGPDTTHWLEQTNEVQVVVVGMHHPAIEGHPVHIPEVDKGFVKEREADPEAGAGADDVERDRKSTRLNSSHVRTSYAVFCLKKKKTTTRHARRSAARRTAPRTSLPCPSTRRSPRHPIICGRCYWHPLAAARPASGAARNSVV